MKSVVTAAFKDVRLGRGCSLRSAREAEYWGNPPEDTDIGQCLDVDIADNWTALSLETLDEYPYLAHMDAEGFRYYIPAFMLSLLDEYEPKPMRVICTLSALYPSKQNDLWEYHMNLYSLFSQDQSVTVAHYLQELPALIELDQGDQKGVERALRNYWHTFL